MNAILRKSFGYVGGLIQIVAGVHCTFEYLFDFVVCNGPSMEPTLFTNNILLTDKISPRIGKITRGDIVISKHPNKPQQLICKRVLGTPGDIILAPEVTNETLIGEEVEGIQDIQFKKVVVPRGHVWLEGDNSSNSSDSRHYGPLPQGLLVSRVALRLYPLHSIGFI